MCWRPTWCCKRMCRHQEDCQTTKYWRRRKRRKKERKQMAQDEIKHKDKTINEINLTRWMKVVYIISMKKYENLMWWRHRIMSIWQFWEKEMRSCSCGKTIQKVQMVQEPMRMLWVKIIQHQWKKHLIKDYPQHNQHPNLCRCRSGHKCRFNRQTSETEGPSNQNEPKQNKQHNMQVLQSQ